MTIASSGPITRDLNHPEITLLGAVIDLIEFVNGRKAGPLLESPVTSGEPAYDLDE